MAISLEKFLRQLNADIADSKIAFNDGVERYNALVNNLVGKISKLDENQRYYIASVFSRVRDFSTAIKFLEPSALNKSFVTLRGLELLKILAYAKRYSEYREAAKFFKDLNSLHLLNQLQIAVQLIELEEYAARDQFGLCSWTTLAHDGYGFKYSTDSFDQLGMISNVAVHRGLVKQAIVYQDVISYKILLDQSMVYRLEEWHEASIGHTCASLKKIEASGEIATSFASDQLWPRETEVLFKNSSPDHLVFVSQDINYFREHGTQLAKSIKACSPGTELIIEVIDATARESTDVVETVGKLGLPIILCIFSKSPQSGLTEFQNRKTFYHLKRFSTLQRLLKLFQVPIFMLDADSLCNRPLMSVFEGCRNFDVGLRVRPGRIHPWNHFNASGFLVNPTPVSFEYLSSINNFIFNLWSEGRARWGCDQLALWLVYVGLFKGKLSIKCLTEYELDYENSKHGVVFQNSGAGKQFLHIRAISGDSSALSFLNHSKFIEDVL